MKTLLSLILLLATSLCWSSEPEVKIKDLGEGKYFINGVFETQASSEVVLEVLTDFNHISNFVPIVELSRVVQSSEVANTVQTDSTLLVEQRLVIHKLWFSKRVHLLLDIEIFSNSILFTDILQDNFEIYNGQWIIKPTNNGTKIVYNLLIQPKFVLPGFIVKRAMEHGSIVLIRQISQEIDRRALVQTY